MEGVFGLFVMLWALLGGGRSSGGGGGSRGPVDRPVGPEASRRPKGGGVLVQTPPWPAVTPSGLPPFPGSGWEPDEPPPKTVQQRAGELLQPLWNKGKGAHQIEQTAGRWIAYQAGITAGNRHGVIAWRLKRAAAPPAPRAPAARAPSARPPAAPAAPAVVVPKGTQQVQLPGQPAVPASVFEPPPVLRRGRGMKPAAPDKDVKLVQQRLGIQADGRFGKDTESAVKLFQKSHGLAVDGVVGKNTWVAIFAVRA